MFFKGAIRENMKVCKNVIVAQVGSQFLYADGGQKAVQISGIVFGFNQTVIVFVKMQKGVGRIFEIS